MLMVMVAVIRMEMAARGVGDTRMRNRIASYCKNQEGNLSSMSLGMCATCIHIYIYISSCILCEYSSERFIVLVMIATAVGGAGAAPTRQRIASYCILGKERSFCA